MTELPKWVWDLIMNLQQQEEEHPNLYVRVDAKYPEQGFSYQQALWCPRTALHSVPVEIESQAKAIRDYTRQVDRDKEGKADGAGR